MLRSLAPRRLAAFGVAALLGLAACSESPSAPTDLALVRRSASAIGDVTTPAALLADNTLWARTVWACKVGTDATVSTTVFPYPFAAGDAAVETSIADGTCVAVNVNNGATFEVDSVAVSEVASPNYVLDSVNVKLARYGLIQSSVTHIGNYIAGIVTTVPPNPAEGKGGIVTFYNSPVIPPPPPPPEGGQGCTPGYWKQTQHFDSWVGYSPNQLFSSVFEDAFPGKTLLQVLEQGGGGLNALGRHTVAALLNTANSDVSYDLTTAGVISAFNGVFPGSDYEAQKNIFARFNEQGCSIN